MGGGGSSGAYRIPPSEVAARRREAEKAARAGQTDAEVNAVLSERLIDINRRDTEAVSDRLEEIEEVLPDRIEGLDRLLFGGSVAKQTYVEGLSDIDSLVILRGEDLAEKTPDEVKAELEKQLNAKLDKGRIDEISSGDLAVTVRYKDGLEIQLLPAVERDKELSISSLSGERWVSIEPRAFAARLTKVNKEQAGAVVPAIKLAKSVLASEPDAQRPGGYHLEALAVAAFEGYTGPRNPKAMLTHLFESAAQNVKRPIHDVTGQSKNVDEDLGAANSIARRRIAGELGRIARRMRNAPSVDAWRALLGDE